MTFDKTQLHCTKCGSANVQVQLPAWFSVTDSVLKFDHEDGEAEELSTFCCECCTQRPLWDPVRKRPITGRWDI